MQLKASGPMETVFVYHPSAQMLIYERMGAQSTRAVLPKIDKDELMCSICGWEYYLRVGTHAVTDVL